MPTDWRNLEALPARQWTCGYCGNQVAGHQGYQVPNQNHYAYPCPYCGRVTDFDGGLQTPGPVFGQPVEHVPSELGVLYDEARRCMSVSGYTSVVLACRKILMHIAVVEGAAPNKPFAAYVKFLSEGGYLPPKSKDWVDHIRSKGNEANHEIRLMDRTEAQELLAFIEMLLEFLYEFPAKSGANSAPGAASEPPRA